MYPTSPLWELLCSPPFLIPILPSRITTNLLLFTSSTTTINGTILFITRALCGPLYTPWTLSFALTPIRPASFLVLLVMILLSTYSSSLLVASGILPFMVGSSRSTSLIQFSPLYKCITLVRTSSLIKYNKAPLGVFDYRHHVFWPNDDLSPLRGFHPRSNQGDSYCLQDLPLPSRNSHRWSFGAWNP